MRGRSVGGATPVSSHLSILAMLYMSGFGEVGNEGHHDPHVHPGADGDGESSQEQSSSGRDAGHREVALRHGFAGLKRKK